MERALQIGEEGGSYSPILRELEGKTVAVVGGGPSLAEVDLEPLRGRLTVCGVNNAFLKAPWCEYLYFADARWAAWHERELAAYPGILVTGGQKLLPAAIAARVRRHKKITAPKFMWTEPPVMTAEPDAISGADSGAQAINLVVQMGAKRVVLLGFDMKFNGRQAHWHDEPPRRSRPPPPRITAAADARGVAVLNATQGSAITCYPAVTLAEVLAEAG
jgi:hypothetical protein